MSPRVRVPLLLALTCAALAPASASAQELRFTTTAPGGVIGTGNTLGLSKALNLNGPGTEDSIGTFISLGNGVDDQPANPANPWPAGTTNDWTKNGSSAELALPESEVLYAELLWGGSYLYGEEDVSGDLESAVTLSSGDVLLQVSPDPATALTIAETGGMGAFAVNYYMRSADVTAFVKQAGAGVYEVSGVPATQTTAINSLNAAGWTLVVAYRDEGAPTRNLSVFVGGSFVDEDSQQDYAVSGFCAPPAGVVEGTAIVSTIEGDADIVGDKLLIAPTVAGPFVDLSGPNNPANNFFCSQINDAMGNLDAKGTFGAANHDAKAGKNVSGGRQGWDVTTVPLSSQDKQLQNGQKSATIRTSTTGDSFIPILAAFAIDVNAPDFTDAASSAITAPDQVKLGDKFTTTVTLKNGGEVTAQDIAFSLPLEDSLAVVSVMTDGKAGDINGAAVDAAGLVAGIDAGDLPSGQTRTIVVETEVVGPPKIASFFLKAKWAYGFEVCSGSPLLEESFSQSALVKFEGASSSASSGSGATSTSASTSSGSAGGEGGASGEGGAGGTGAASGGGGEGDVESGCSCSAPGRDPRGYAAAASLGLLGLSALRRRRRSR